jgi:hypothetical protein
VLLVGWAASRVKPLYWYGGLLGLLIAVVALGVHAWFPRPRRWLAHGEVCLLALCGVLLTFWFSTERSYAAALKSQQPGLAEALMTQLEQHGEGIEDLPENAWQAVPMVQEQADWQHRLKWWLWRRYGRTLPGDPWTAAGLEMGLAALVAGIGFAAGQYWIIPSRPASPRADSP